MRLQDAANPQPYLDVVVASMEKARGAALPGREAVAVHEALRAVHELLQPRLRRKAFWRAPGYAPRPEE